MAFARRREKWKSDVPLLYGALLKGVQVSVEAIGGHQVIVRAHFGHDAAVNYANHVGVPYGGQTVGYSDARSALHGFVQGRLHGLRTEKEDAGITRRQRHFSRGARAISGVCGSEREWHSRDQLSCLRLIHFNRRRKFYV